MKEPIPVTYMPAERPENARPRMSSAGSESRGEATFLGYKLLSQPAATNARVPILMDALAMAKWILHEPPLWTFGVWRSDRAGGPECTALPQAKFLVEVATGAKRTVERGLLGRHSTPDEAGGHLSAHSDSLRQCRK
jgi:hypothetical protein